MLESFPICLTAETTKVDDGSVKHLSKRTSEGVCFLVCRCVCVRCSGSRDTLRHKSQSQLYNVLSNVSKVRHYILYISVALSVTSGSQKPPVLMM